MRLAASIAGLALLTAMAPSVARADHVESLHAAACVYRDLVHELEVCVDEHQRVSSYTDRYVHRLAAASDLLHDRSEHPEDLHRLRSAFDEVSALHERVESLLVTHGHHPDPTLVAMMQHASIALDQVCQSIDYLVAAVPQRRTVVATPYGGYSSVGRQGSHPRSSWGVSPYVARRGSTTIEFRTGKRPSVAAPYVASPNPALEHSRAPRDHHGAHSLRGDRHPTGSAAYGNDGLRSQIIGSLLTRLLD